MEELRVTSSDGVELYVRRSGNGDPLVLVHGTSARNDSFGLVEPALAERYTVTAYDRRGRGRSGDRADHSLDQEVDDLLTVVETAGTPTHIVGHSFGAVCALEAARRQATLRSVVVYEPPLRMERNPRSLVDRAFGEADVEERMEAFHELCGISSEEQRIMRSIPGLWEGLLEGMSTAKREALALESLRWDPQRWSTVAVPVLYLYGAESDRPVYPTREEFRAAVPHAELLGIEGQRHLAFAFAPERFAEAVLVFLTEAEAAPR